MRLTRPAPSAAVLLDAGLVLAGLVALTLTPRNVGGDGQSRFDAMRSLSTGQFLHEKYSLVVPVLALPFDWVGRQLGAEVAVVYRFNTVVFALGLLGLFLLLRRTDAAVVRPFLLLLVFASMFPAHVNNLYGETLTAMALGVGVLAVASDRARTLGWVLVVVAAVNTPAAVPAVALVVVLHVLRTRRPLGLLVPPLILGLVVLDSRLHTGSFTSPYDHDIGYRTVLPYSGTPGFSYPAVLGVLVILVSFGRGLLFFAPGLFLPLRSRLAGLPAVRAVHPLWVALVVGLVAVYCRWWAWYGGFFWGPRFFLFASVPAALVLAVRLATPARSLGSAVVTVGAVALSTWVAVCACVGAVGQQVCTADLFAREDLCWYSPEFSVLWRPVMHWPALAAAQQAYLALAVGVLLRLTVPYLAAARRTAPLRPPAWLTPQEGP